MITCIIPTHNDSDQLIKTIDSCITEESVAEIIVINDASSAAISSDVIEYMMLMKCKYIVNDINYGLGGARNNAIQQAKYDWIIPLDTGDVFYLGGVNSLWDAACEDTFLSDVYYGNITDKYTTDDPRHHIAKPTKNITRESFSKDNPLFCSSLFSKEIWKKAGGYTMREYSHYEDYGFWCKVLKAGGKFKYVDTLVYHHSSNDNSMLSTLHEHTDYFKRLARWEFDRKQIFYDI